MELKRDSLLFKYAYFVESKSHSSIPYRTSLCAFVWRLLLFVPLGMAFWSIYTAAYYIFLYPFILLSIPIVALLNRLIPKKVFSNIVDRIEPKLNVVAMTIDALHDKVCPTISIEEYKS